MVEYKDEQFNLDEIPEFALQPAREPEVVFSEEIFSPPVQLVSAGDLLQTKEISYRNLFPGPRVCFEVEEELLIPDSKPDLQQVLSAAGEGRLGETEFYAGKEGLRFLKAAGDLCLQILYRSQDSEAGDSLVAWQTKIPFREDVEVNASPEAEISLSACLQDLEYSVINERKLRIRAVICLDTFEYRFQKQTLLQDTLDPEMQCRKESFRVTDILARKRERLDLREVLTLREGMPEIGEILSSDVRLGAVSRQVDSEKAVVNVPVFYNILYRRPEDIFSEIEGPDTAVLQGRTEFTQFLSPGESLDRAGDCRVRCRICQVAMEPSLDSSGRQSQAVLTMAVETFADFYGEKEVVNITDLYHRNKEALFQREEGESLRILPDVKGEVSVRERIPLVGDYAGAKVLYGRGTPRLEDLSVQGSEVLGGGVLDVSLVCEDSRSGSLSSLERSFPFRFALNVPGGVMDAESFAEVFLQDLWLDSPSGQGVEVNASVGVRVSLLKKQAHSVLKNVSLAELPGGDPLPSVLVCLAREGDDLWSVSKRYRGNPDTIGKINRLPASGIFERGEKILVIR